MANKYKQFSKVQQVSEPFYMYRLTNNPDELSTWSVYHKKVLEKNPGIYACDSLENLYAWFNILNNDTLGPKLVNVYRYEVTKAIELHWSWRGDDTVVDSSEAYRKEDLAQLAPAWMDGNVAIREYIIPQDHIIGYTKLNLWDIEEAFELLALELPSVITDITKGEFDQNRMAAARDEFNNTYKMED